ncbi:MAG: winged helix-turn-helix transcriptional regulator [Oscillospiraceae bacterium]|nr:winged helix-turn-helix transcriptional regulator [Oscillospiraceae bacterium]
MARSFSSPCYNTNARRIAGILTETYNAALTPSGLNTAQFCLLRNLERLGSGNLTVWAEKTGIERTTMVRDAKVLEAGGFIRQLEGRGKVFALSEKGKEALAQATPLWKSAQESVRTVLGEEDAAALLRIGQKLLKL